MKELGSGRFGANEPLLTHRAWAKELMVSHFTVSKAMDLLKAQGIVESSEGSYTFYKGIDKERPEAKSVKENGPAEICLWFNDQRNVRRIRQGIVRQRFQNKFSGEASKVSFVEEAFDVSFSAFRSQLLEAFLRGGRPTLGEFPQTYLSMLNSYEVLGELASPEASKYLDQIDERYLEHSFFDGKCGFLPFSCSYSYLVCNTELMRKAGLNPDDEFKSWGDFAEKCESLKRVCAVEPLHVSENGLYWLLAQWIYQADDCLPLKGRLPLIDWQSDAARAGVDFLIEMVFDRKLIRVSGPDRLAQTSPFLAGQTPIVMEEIMLSAALELDQTDAFTLKAFPTGPNGIQLSMMNTAGWVVNANSEKAAQIHAGKYAFEWEKWIHAREGGSTMRKLGVAPGLNSLFKNPRKDQFCSNKLPKNWQKVFDQLKECGRWEASDSDLVSIALAPILLSEFRTAGQRPNPELLLKHLLLAQYDAGILSKRGDLDTKNQTRKSS